MAKVTINPPANASWPLNTGDSAERGDNAKTFIEKVNAMFTELYASVTGAVADVAAFTTTTASVTIDRVLVAKSYTVATLPDPVAAGVIYVSDGAAGSPILAFSDGTDWLRCDTAAAVAAA